MKFVDILPPKLELYINSIVKKIGYTDYMIQNRYISTNGGNFLGDLYEVDVKGTTKDGDEETNVFVKVINGGEEMKVVHIHEVYKRETYAYLELSRIFEELQDEANIPSQVRYKMVKSYDESSTEVVILENIARKGFETYHRAEVISLEFAEMSIRELAKFHSLSYILQAKRRDYYNEKIKGMKLPYRDWQGFVKSMFDVIINYVDDDLREKIDKWYSEFTQNYNDFMGDDSNYCLCHGDYRPDNIMMKVSNGAITDVIPIDYQLIHHGCPLFDFLYFIFVSTDRGFRQNHLEYLKDQYYDTMSEFLKYSNIDINIFYPKTKYDKDFSKCLSYGLIVGVAILPFMLAPKDHVPDVTEELTGTNIRVNDTYKERLRGIIEDFVDWGYIQ